LQYSGNGCESQGRRQPFILPLTRVDISAKRSGGQQRKSQAANVSLTSPFAFPSTCGLCPTEQDKAFSAERHRSEKQLRSSSLSATAG